MLKNVGDPDVLDLMTTFVSHSVRTSPVSLFEYLLLLKQSIFLACMTSLHDSLRVDTVI